MIKFFRKIRQKLLSENKFSKYLIYAIGEIILVVIGILIALQVNEWNSDRNKRKSEKILLVQLKSDLEKSKIELGEIKEYHLDRARASTIILQSFWKTETPNDSIVNYFQLAGSTKMYSPILGTTKSLISSGNIDLISSSEFKNDIVSYVEKVESKLKDIKRHEESYFRKGVELIDEIMPNTVQPKEYYIKRFDEATKEDLDRWDETGLFIVPKNLDMVPFKSDLKNIFQNKLFFRGYKKLYLYQYNGYRIYDEILILTIELLDKLNSTELVKTE
ncbi:DUF6090 family protein [Winogradskyella sp. A2]|uniref:DUF6090 family protein n=1 Tax=Winogradskyella sp. A2 TaxID=3366944 RepID=UPI00398C7D96